MKPKVVTVGKRGMIVIPASLSRRFGVQEGDRLIAEDRGNGIFIVPVVAVPVEIYSLTKKAEFLLSNETGVEDYKRACKEVRKSGLDPHILEHHKPSH